VFRISVELIEPEDGNARERRGKRIFQKTGTLRRLQI
jgi:hypothetical protein